MEDFEFEFPLWACFGKNDAMAVFGGILKGNKPFVAIFTDENLANLFLAEVGESESWLPARILEAVSCLDLLRRWERDGFAMVVIDSPGKTGKTRWTLPIGDMIRAVEGLL